MVAGAQRACGHGGTGQEEEEEGQEGLAAKEAVGERGRTRTSTDQHGRTGTSMDENDEGELGSLEKPYREILADIRRRQRARGHQPRKREEIDAFLLAERESWGEDQLAGRAPSKSA
jgi:hypothetical protein